MAVAPSALPAPPPSPAPVAAPQQAPPGAAACPVCGAALAPGALRCEICGFEPGSSVVIPGGSAIPRATSANDQSTRVCPIHGPLDPSWTRCPYCLREGREGRLPSGPIGAVSNAGRAPEPPRPAPPPAPVSPVTAQAAMAPPAEPVVPVSPYVAPQRVEPGESIVPAGRPPEPSLPDGAAAARATAPPSPPAPSPSPSPAAPRPSPLRAGEAPPSSVGATFAIRRRPRVLAYLIEREGEAVGRVHQLEDDVTDLGRDPRNHIVLGDVLISGFHARVERGPDGNFLVQDRQSTNGTFVNDEPVTQMRMLDENDVLRLGNTTLVLKLVN